jgi:endonuclease/exonuclease/phosphatase (EEP) superfamily protein YafD
MGGKVFLVGDFNTPADSPIFREAFSGYDDAFDAVGFGFGTTYAKHHTSLRIDHVIYGNGWKCRRCYASDDVGSGHRAVMAEMTR